LGLGAWPQTPKPKTPIPNPHPHINLIKKEKFDYIKLI